MIATQKQNQKRKYELAILSEDVESASDTSKYPMTADNRYEKTASNAVPLSENSQNRQSDALG